MSKKKKKKKNKQKQAAVKGKNTGKGNEAVEKNHGNKDEAVKAKKSGNKDEAAKAKKSGNKDEAAKDDIKIEEYQPVGKTVAGVKTSIDEGEQKPSATAESNLEWRKMKRSERVKAKREWIRLQTEDMSAKQKFGYYLYYYKWSVILGALALFLLITIPITIYKKTRPVALSYAVINCNEPAQINKGFVDDFIQFYQIDPSYQVIVDGDVSLRLADYTDSTIHSTAGTDYSQFPLLCHNNYFDLVFTDWDGLEFCASQAVIQPLEYALYSDVYELMKEEYGDKIVEAENYNGDMTPYAIDISDTAFAQSFGLGYDTVYLCFPGTAERNFTNNRKFLNYIYGFGMDL